MKQSSLDFLILPLFFMGLATAGLAVIAIVIPVNSVVVATNDIELWYTQAPFGELYGDVSGSFAWGTGHINTAPAEAYSVKYWHNGQLKSLTLDATETPIEVDGTFKLTVQTVKGIDIYGFQVSDKPDRYILHLPSLPDNVTRGMLAP